MNQFVRLDERTQRTLMRVLVVVIGGAAYALALNPGASLVQLLASAYGIVSQLAPPVVAGLYWRRATTAGVVTGLVAGWATAGFFFLNPALRPYGMHEGILALLVHVPVLVAVSLLTRPQAESHLRAYFPEARPS